MWLGSNDEQFIISKRHGPLFHLLLSTMDKYEPDIELSPETTTPTSTDSTADFFDSDGKTDFSFAINLYYGFFYKYEVIH